MECFDVVQSVMDANTFAAAFSALLVYELLGYVTGKVRAYCESRGLLGCR